MRGPDYYEALGVDRNATPEEIKKAFRKKAMIYHPDRNPDDPKAEDRFKEVQEAYQTLSDPNDRAYYDRTGRSGRSARSEPFDFTTMDPVDFFSDLLGQFFGSRPGTVREPGRGADVRLNVTVTFKEAAFGSEAKIKAPIKASCPACHGTGARPGSSPDSCYHCDGTGEQVVDQRFFAFRRRCRHCDGTGRVIHVKCSTCGGIGAIASEKSLTVKIPQGIKDGTRLKLGGQGDPGRNGAKHGDLYVIVNVEPHPRFVRRDDDVIVELPISFPQAALGADVAIPTLDGEEMLRVPAGVQPGKVFNLRGKGIPHGKGTGRGDQMVVINVEVPKRLNEHQRELIRRLAELNGDTVEPKKRGILDTVKEILK